MNYRNNILSPEILEFLKYKINYSELRSFFRQSNETFQLMLQNGMTYYTNKCYKNILDCEMNVFANMLEILHLWEDEELEIGGEIAKYLKYNIHSGLNLSYLYMNKLDLKGAYLYKANLRGAKLVETDLRNANLVEADLENANLVRINLKNTGILGTILYED